ncbi:ribosomal protein S18-alanine N-acetyltransferase [Paraferrimonas haliotis]|uniref:[Ribosomal protein bS18]-alanine N-acetyltransferase n=1 Tax=Paraferrimonas haliotis TaxID=2013866 RepID=A0AA37TPY1_9GAMM|nr:ribosomal protein S18-alanine N-acetyltransferase [Paraferrimonas haliotis]GLS83558.1 ribosomal-protein-alanine acetyltransferase [Paraferrimonas haliotis]
MSLVLEPIRFEQLALVMEIELAAHKSPWSLNNFSNSFSVKHEFIGAFANGTLVGYYVSQYVLDEASLLNICVQPTQQGKGYGRELLADCVARAIAHDISQMFLEVRSSNHAAIGLYHSFDFNEIGVRKGYYPNDSKNAPREDAIMMAAYLG